MSKRCIDRRFHEMHTLGKKTRCELFISCTKLSNEGREAAKEHAASRAIYERAVFVDGSAQDDGFSRALAR